MNIVVFGLSLSSSWGNGHATTWRGLLGEMARRGHGIVFFERDVPWYAANRDLPDPDWCELVLYEALSELEGHRSRIAAADAVIVGSFVPEGVALVDWLAGACEPQQLAFYDIDTPVTVSRLEAGKEDYLAARHVPLFDLYLSFSGGPVMDRLVRRWGARRVAFLGCNADTDVYRPVGGEKRWQLGYLGTYDESRQPALEELLLAPARMRPDLSFAVAGPQYPETIRWPDNVDRFDHLPPGRHAAFYSALRLALNVTRSDMVTAGFSPSVRIFEAAACGTPVASDVWRGLETFFMPGEEIFAVGCRDDVLALLDRPDALDEVGRRGRARVLREHSARCRAARLESLLGEAQPVRQEKQVTL